VTIIRNESGGDVNRGYVGDTGGNLWRIDFKSDNPSDTTVENLNGTTVTKIASIADHSVLPGGLRKFLHAPDVVGQEGFDAILIGSGDREHPFDTGVVNRFYMFKDLGGDAGPVTGTGLPLDGNGDPTNVTIAESALFDASNNCIQDCSTDAERVAAQTALGNASGWYITLRTGEKVVGNAVTLGGTTFFATNQPQASVDPGVCTSSLGIARQYAVSAADATATIDYNSSGGLTVSDRSVDVAGGGYLPSPTQGYTYPTRPDGTPSPTPTPFLCFGVNCGSPPAVSFNARVRKYWYKEVDQ
jgi:type IV pilus assembly protein PilY1